MNAPLRLARAALVALAAPVIVAAAGQDRPPRSAPWAGDRFDVMEKTIPELQDAMTSGAITSRDLVDVYLAHHDSPPSPAGSSSSGSFGASRSSAGVPLRRRWRPTSTWSRVRVRDFAAP